MLLVAVDQRCSFMSGQTFPTFTPTTKSGWLASRLLMACIGLTVVGTLLGLLIIGLSKLASLSKCLGCGYSRSFRFSMVARDCGLTNL